jgi:hypothetical protein
MIDTGRRFYSVELVESLLEGMSMMKMNVMVGMPLRLYSSFCYEM